MYNHISQPTRQERIHHIHQPKPSMEVPSAALVAEPFYLEMESANQSMGCQKPSEMGISRLISQDITNIDEEYHIWRCFNEDKKGKRVKSITRRPGQRSSGCPNGSPLIYPCHLDHSQLAPSPKRLDSYPTDPTFSDKPSQVVGQQWVALSLQLVFRLGSWLCQQKWFSNLLGDLEIIKHGSFLYCKTNGFSAILRKTQYLPKCLSENALPPKKIMVFHHFPFKWQFYGYTPFSDIHPLEDMFLGFFGQAVFIQ
jgi:hypothetical protein